MSVRHGGLLQRTKAPLVAKEKPDTDTEKAQADRVQPKEDTAEDTVHVGGDLEATVVTGMPLESDIDGPASNPGQLTLNEPDDTDEVVYTNEDAQPETELNDEVDETALEEFEEVDLRSGREPKSWLSKALIIADPFILSKVRRCLLSLLSGNNNCISISFLLSLKELCGWHKSPTHRTFQVGVSESRLVTRAGS